MFAFSSCGDSPASIQQHLSPLELEKVQLYANTELDKAPGQLKIPEIPEGIVLVSDSLVPIQKPSKPKRKKRSEAQSKPASASEPVTCDELKPCTAVQQTMINQIDENIHQSLIYYRQATDSIVKLNLRKDLEKQRKDRNKKVHQYLTNCHDCK